MSNITQDLLRTLFEYRDGKLYWRVSNSNRARIGSEAGTVMGNGYRTIRINGQGHRRHRLVWLMHHNHLPKEIDHINRDRADDRIENLRAVTTSENRWNRGPEVRGCYWHRKSRKWMARIMKHSEYHYLGLFDTETEAHEAYLAAKMKHHIIGEH